MNYIEIRVKLDGMYAMGPGFLTQEASYNWHEYFRNYNGIHWKAFIDDFGTVHLVSIHCGGMIHPMDGLHFVAVNHGYMKNFKSEIAELDKIFKEVCEKCNGTYEIESRVFEG